MTKMDLQAFNKRISNLFILDARYRTIIKYFESRRRSSDLSDLNQLSVYIKDYAKKNDEQPIENHHIHFVLKAFTEFGIGKFEKKGSKNKFRWIYWPFPIFDSNGRYKGMDFEEIETLRKIPGSFKVAVNHSHPGKDAVNLSLDELIKEINKLGFKVTLEPLSKD